MLVLERDSFLGCFGVLHYGDIEVTKKCINSLLRLNKIQDCLIIILDNDLRTNAKKDLSRIFQSFPNVQLIKTEEKCGFSKANNYLYKHCLSYHLRFIAMLNNDIEIYQMDFIDKLMKIVNQEKYYIIGPDIYKQSTDDHQSPLELSYPGVEKINNTMIRQCRDILVNDDSVYKVIKQKKNIILAHECLPNFLFYIYRCISQGVKIALRYKQPHEDCILSGACLIFTDKFIMQEKIAFYPETEFYFEEMILGLRCTYKGYKTLFTPTLKVYHQHAASALQDAESLVDYEKTAAKRMLESFEILKKFEETNDFM